MAARRDPCMMQEVLEAEMDKANPVEFEQPRSLSQRDAIFQAERSHLVDQTGSRADHLVAYPMQRLEVSLFLALDCCEPHRRPSGSFGDGLGIDNVTLVRLHVGLT